MTKKERRELTLIAVVLVVLFGVLYLFERLNTKEVTIDTAEHPADQAAISRQQTVDLGLSVKWAGWNVGAKAPEEAGPLYSLADDWYDAAQWRKSEKWRLPDFSEMKELIDKCQWQWTTYRGTVGCMVTGPNGHAIFLPAAGAVYDTKTDAPGTNACLWTRHVRSRTHSGGRYMYFDCDSTEVNDHYGRLKWRMSVRLVRE